MFWPHFFFKYLFLHLVFLLFNYIYSGLYWFLTQNSNLLNVFTVSWIDIICLKISYRLLPFYIGYNLYLILLFIVLQFWRFHFVKTYSGGSLFICLFLIFKLLLNIDCFLIQYNLNRVCSPSTPSSFSAPPLFPYTIEVYLFSSLWVNYNIIIILRSLLLLTDLEITFSSCLCIYRESSLKVICELIINIYSA